MTRKHPIARGAVFRIIPSLVVIISFLDVRYITLAPIMNGILYECHDSELLDIVSNPQASRSPIRNTGLHLHFSPDRKLIVSLRCLHIRRHNRDFEVGYLVPWDILVVHLKKKISFLFPLQKYHSIH